MSDHKPAHLFQQLFEHLLSILALVFNIQQFSGTHSVFVQRFNKPVREYNTKFLRGEWWGKTEWLCGKKPASGFFSTSEELIGINRTDMCANPYVSDQWGYSWAYSLRVLSEVEMVYFTWCLPKWPICVPMDKYYTILMVQPLNSDPKGIVTKKGIQGQWKSLLFGQGDTSPKEPKWVPRKLNGFPDGIPMAPPEVKCKYLLEN